MIFVKNEILKCEFCEKWDFENVILANNDILKMWLLWKIRFWKCDFCEKWDFENVILLKMIFWTCEFLELCEFLDKMRIFAPNVKWFKIAHCGKNWDFYWDIAEIG